MVIGIVLSIFVSLCLFISHISSFHPTSIVVIDVLMMLLLLACANKCDFGSTEVVVSPPYVFLPVVKSLLRSDFHVAAQNCWVRKGGAYTGEIRYDIPSWLFHSFCVLHIWSFHVLLNHIT